MKRNDWPWFEMDRYDVLALTGVGLIGAGLWLVSPALSLTVVGAVVLAIAVGGSWRASGRRKP